jgi:prepilin-type N-terminal cleavage/methylation domain-containing protein
MSFRGKHDGFTLLEALVALAILAIALLGLVAIRTDAVVTSVRTRNLKLARELAERVLATVEAGDHEYLETGIEKNFDDYAKFTYIVLVGDEAVDMNEQEAAETLDATSTSNSDQAERTRERLERNRVQRMRQQGLDPYALQDPEDDPMRRLAAEKPTETDFETVAVIVSYPDDTKATNVGRFKLKRKISMLALSGLTPQQAEDRHPEAPAGANSSDPTTAPGNGGGTTSPGIGSSR